MNFDYQNVFTFSVDGTILETTPLKETDFQALIQYNVPVIVIKRELVDSFSNEICIHLHRPENSVYKKVETLGTIYYDPDELNIMMKKCYDTFSNEDKDNIKAFHVHRMV